MSEFRLRVATYNIHKCRGLDRRTDPDRIAAVIRELDADVIAIQEILDVSAGKPEYDQVRRITESLPDYRHCFGDNRPLHGGVYGNMTLSRLPVRFCENYDITWRKRERRGCLRTDIATANGELLHLFNVHLGTGFVERRHQARRLLTDALLKRSDLSAPRIVAGDFNEWTRGLATRLMGTEFKAVEPRAFMRYARTYPGVLPFLHLDHFYYDKHLSLKSYRMHRSRRALLASDHLPIVAEFELREAKQ